VTMDMQRRKFFAGYPLTLLHVFLRELSGSAQTQDRSMKDHYFDSFESCYPLLAEAGEMLMEEAQKRGINIEGKSEHDIARELFQSLREKTV
jgi:hypothetical protein